MNCKKHLGLPIPCPTCMLDEYLYAQKQNDDLIKEGKLPKHNIAQLESELRSLKLIP